MQAIDNSMWSAYEKVLRANDVAYEVHTCDGVNHSFHNDSTGRYAEPEAELAWGAHWHF